ncbi:hypothetical protein GGR52DRAFT_110822 [Hypoxylon sp. FL1284]|nr:hypothetical protein GGR52DRAFT_110822 [Hypoxylon sp. FL1284]
MPLGSWVSDWQIIVRVELTADCARQNLLRSFGRLLTRVRMIRCQQMKVARLYLRVIVMVSIPIATVGVLAASIIAAGVLVASMSSMLTTDILAACIPVVDVLAAMSVPLIVFVGILSLDMTRECTVSEHTFGVYPWRHRVSTGTGLS